MKLSKAKKDQALALGKQAYRADIKAPCLDQTMQAMVKEYTAPQFTQEYITLLKLWNKGYTIALLDEPLTPIIDS